MSNEEAIKVLTEQLAYSDDVLPARLKEAYEVAINSICTISQNAPEKEKIFADFNDSLQGINSEYGLSYYLYSNIYNIGRKLADKEYQQGRADAIDEVVNLYEKWTKLEKPQQAYYWTVVLCKLKEIAEQMKGETKCQQK